MSKLHRLQLPFRNLSWLFPGSTSRRWLRCSRFPTGHLRFIVRHASSATAILFESLTRSISRLPLFCYIEGFPLGLENFDTDLAVSLQSFLIEFTLAGRALDQMVTLVRLLNFITELRRRLRLIIVATKRVRLGWSVHDTGLFRPKRVFHIFVIVICSLRLIVCSHFFLRLRVIFGAHLRCPDFANCPVRWRQPCPASLNRR